jgi:rod shape determining protein RodA
MFKRLWSLPIEWFVLIIPIILTITGIITIYTITYPDYQWKLTLDQIVFASIGLGALLVFMFTDYRLLSSIPGVIYIVGLVFLALLLPFIAPRLPFVSSVFGATRWIDFGFFQLQPSELFKLLGTIVAAAFLAKRVGRISVLGLIVYTFLVGIPVAMVLVEPNLGTTAVLVFIFGCIFIAAKPSPRIIAFVVAATIIAVPLVFMSLKPYQKTRVETFLNMNKQDNANATTAEKEKSKDAKYNVTQALIAVGSGGLLGRGFGQGSQTVLNFLPVAHSDFIFAGFAEATGFVGSFAILFLYFILLMRIISVAGQSTDPFGQLFAIGIAAKFFIQVVVHIGMNLGLLPVTGIPLPFMSYGGTAIIIDMASVGIILNIFIRHKKFLFS